MNRIRNNGTLIATQPFVDSIQARLKYKLRTAFRNWKSCADMGARRVLCSGCQYQYAIPADAHTKVHLSTIRCCCAGTAR
jgi:hypothetical protein